MANNDVTMKAKFDISDLKKGVIEAKRQIKLANAEFKAASSAFENWGKSTQGIQTKLKQLNTVLTQEKTILANYKAQLAQVESEQGKNSKAADEMRIKIANQQAAVNKTEQSIKKYSTQLSELEQEQAKAAEAANKEESALNRLQSEINQQESDLKKLKQEYQNLVVEQKEGTQEAQELAGEIDALSSDLKQNKNALHEAEKAADELDKSYEEVGNEAETASGGFTVMKGALANLAADGIRLCIQAMKDFVTETINVGKEFDSSMSKVGAVSGATTDELELLRDKAKEMGSSTKFTASEAAEAFNYMAMAGWKTEDMLGGIEGVLNLAAASGSDLATTSDIVTDALTAMGYGAEDAGRLADVMAAASSNANTNVEMMGQTFQYAAPIVGALGYDMEDTAVAIGLMANAGIKGEKSGTALRSILTRLSAPPAECAKAMEELGISMTDSQGNMKDLDTIMGDLRKAFDGLSETEQTSYAKHIAGQEAMSGLLAIVNAAPEDYDKLTEAVNNSNGAAEEMATTMQDNLGGDLTKLSSKMEGVKLALYEKFEPAMRQGVKILDKFADGLKWIVQHSSQIITGIKMIGAATVTYVGMSTAIKVMTDGWKSVTLAVKAAEVAQKLLNTAMLANPYALLIAGLAAACTAIYAYYTDLEKGNKQTRELTAETEKLQDEYDQFSDTLDENKKAREENVEGGVKEAKQAEIMLGKLEKLADKEHKSAAEKKLMKQYVEDLNEIYPDLNLQYDEEKDKLNKSTEAIRENIEASKELALAKAAQENLTSIAADIADAEIKQADAAEQNKKNLTAYNKALKETQEWRQKFDESGQKDVIAYDKWVEADANMRALQKTYEKSQALVDKYTDKVNKLNQEFDSTEQYATDKLNSIELDTALNQLVESAKKEGVEIPKAITEGIQSGKFAIPTSVAELQSLINFNGLSTKAKDAGISIPKSLTDGIASGSITPSQAVSQMNNLISFNDLLSESSAAGAKVPDYISAGIAAGQYEPQTAVEMMQDLVTYSKMLSEAEKAGISVPEAIQKQIQAGQMKPAEAIQYMSDLMTYDETLKKAEKAGTKIPDEITKGVQSGKTKPSEAIKQINDLVDKQTKNAQKEAEKGGKETGDKYAKGIESKKEDAKKSGKEVGDKAIAGVDESKTSAKTSGENFGLGYVNGILAKKQAAYDAGYATGKAGAKGLKEGQKEGSPSKLTYQSGVYFTQGYINGIASMQGQLVTTVKKMVSVVVSEMKNLSDYNFTEVAQNASTKFASAMSSQTSYILAKMQYQNEAKLKEFDTAISKLQSKSTKATNKLQKASDKKVSALEKKKSKAKTSKAKKAVQKQIDSEKASVKKQIAASEKSYTKLINKQTEYKEAYQTASSQMISEFQTAMSDYQTKAQSLIDDTINGITDTYNTRYNELITKQDTLIEKLKSAGDLFTVSSAGIMTVNDLTEQTKQIKEYTSKLQNIKNKVSSELFDEIASFDMKEGSAYIDRLLSMSASDLDAYNKAYTEKIQTAQKAAESIYKADFDKVAADYKKELNTAFSSLPAQLEALGTQAMQGFTNGLTKNTDYMTKNIKTYIKGMVDQFKKQLKISSPSKVMMQIGEYTGEGFNIGLADTLGTIKGTIASAIPKSGIEGVATSTSVINNYNFNQTINSPKAVDRLTVYRQTNSLLFSAKARMA